MSNTSPQKIQALKAKFSGPIKAATSAPINQKLGITICVLLSLTFLFSGKLMPEQTADMGASSLDAFAPVLQVVSSPVQTATKVVTHFNDLIFARERNAELRSELLVLRDVRAKNLQLTAENEELRRLVDAPKRANLSYISARAIGDGRSPWRHSLIINRGKDSGVLKNQLVLAHGVVAGRVTETGFGNARVLLLTDPASRIPVQVGGHKNRAILGGDASLKPQLLYLKKGVIIENGAEVVTSGFGGRIPPGIPVGRVNLSASKVPYVTLYTNANEIDYVHIVDYKLQSHTQFVSDPIQTLSFDE